ncbi:GspMb/PilO family protein [Arenicella xantha]|uniref:Type II secretion system (T2SS) protein M subtype b n=1 Tax=Arenicella xantha TaxID=644221 RepID=A0A395JEU5_9GAMM|nr:GspMb/PilO family protein [Arenicella xantha]RBP47139.1 type II secretion system (T2SS) protein M subtype b [Arenicella xantha]
MISRSQLSQSVLAYLLLAAALWLLWSVAVRPVLSSFESHRQHTNSLRAALDEQRNQQQSNAGMSQLLESGLRDKFARGDLSSSAIGSLVGHHLQESVKALFVNHDASISSLRPSIDEHDDAVSRARLEINFRIKSEQLDSLLPMLDTLRPKLQFELLSLRRHDLRAANTPSFELDGTAVVFVAYISESLRARAVSAGVRPVVFDIVSPQEIDSQSKSRPGSRTQVVGLFDADYRQQLENPSAGHYRLSAISMSSNSQTAIIADTRTGQSYRVTIGDFIQAWTVTEIQANSVVLTSGEATATLSLLADN